MTAGKLLDRAPLLQKITQLGRADWAEELRTKIVKNFSIEQHGTLPQWIDAWNQLPEVSDVVFDASGTSVSVFGKLEPAALNTLRQTLMQFHPWRKGPFHLLGVDLDTEWRSDWKWNRVASAIDFQNKLVLDVGCGNGYYGWKMIAAGAELVLGCDPMLQYAMQFEVFRKYAPSPERHFVVPLLDTDLPSRLHLFDITLSMGVLYHRTSPIDHLQALWQTLKPGGQLLLETLILDRSGMEVLVPPGRYAKMRNVWFIPSLPMLQRWLLRTGFEDIEILDVTPTTADEQRATQWMTYESLADFLDPDDPRRTVEGHPAPVRGLLRARRR